jgi:hypothetical protein
MHAPIRPNTFAASQDYHFRLSAKDITAEASTLYDRWPKLPLDDRRKIAEAVCEKVDIGQGETDITYSCLPPSEDKSNAPLSGMVISLILSTI